MQSLTKMHFQQCLGVFGLALFAFAGTMYADSTATAYCDVGWNSATFSAPVSPLNFPYATYTATDISTLSGNTIGGSEDHNLTWLPTVSTAQLSPQDFTIASANTDLTALSSLSAAVGTYNLSAQSLRSGELLSTDGSVEISVPYALSINLGQGGEGASADVLIEVFNGFDGGGFFDLTSQALYSPPFSPLGDYTSSGTLTYSRDGLPPGEYGFDIIALSSVTNVPEPSAFLLTGTGLFAALVVKKRRSARLDY